MLQRTKARAIMATQRHRWGTQDGLEGSGPSLPLLPSPLTRGWVSSSRSSLPSPRSATVSSCDLERTWDAQDATGRTPVSVHRTKKQAAYIQEAAAGTCQVLVQLCQGGIHQTGLVIRRHDSERVRALGSWSAQFYAHTILRLPQPYWT